MSINFRDFLKLDPEKIRRETKRARKAHGNLVRTVKPHEDKIKFNKNKDRKHFNQKLRYNIDEQHTLTNIRLTDHQKAALAIVISRNNENTTLVDIVSSAEQHHKNNLASAIKTLEHIGLIELNNKELTVTNIGNNVLKDENLIDDSGQLTPEGKKYEFMFTSDEDGKTQDDVNQEMGMPPLGGEPMGSMSEPPLDPAMMGQPEPMMASAKFPLATAIKYLKS